MDILFCIVTGICVVLTGYGIWTVIDDIKDGKKFLREYEERRIKKWKA